MTREPIDEDDVLHADMREKNPQEVGGMLLLEHCRWQAIDVAPYLESGICVRVELANYDEPEDGEPAPTIDVKFFGPPPREGDLFPRLATARLTRENKYSKCICGVVAAGFHLNSVAGKRATIRWWRDCSSE